MSNVTELQYKSDNIVKTLETYLLNNDRVKSYAFVVEYDDKVDMTGSIVFNGEDVKLLGSVSMLKYFIEQELDGN